MGQRLGRTWSCCGAAECQPSLIDVRDMVVDCLAESHGPQFGETRAALGLDSGEPAVRSSVQGIVRLAFQLAGGSFDSPTVDVLAKVVNVLSERSLGWGVPEDTIFEQHCEVMRCLGIALMAQGDEANRECQSH